MTSDFEAPTPQSKKLEEITRDAGVKATASSQLPTLGERLMRNTQRFTSSHVPAFPWLRLVDPVIKRVSSLPIPSQARFQRTEVSRVKEFSRQIPHEPFAEAEGQLLSPDIQQRLRDFVGPGTETMRVHTDETANAIAHALKADAVTVGEQVFFHQGRFRPHEDKGFALLTHEATHVIQAMRPGSSWRRATQAGLQEEEQEASIQERNVLHARREAAFLSQPAQRRASASRYPASPERQGTIERSTIRSERGPLMSEPAVSSSPVHRPMTAPAGRTLDNATPPAPPMPYIEDLKRMIYRDLMRQIRADLERGG